VSDDTDSSRLQVLDTVRCLECGEVYAKPREGGTVEQNPGCPACGYVGWFPVTLPSGRRRFDVGLRPRHSGRRR
jgi:hypothetical protein